MTRILLADDSAYMRGVLKRILGELSDCTFSEAGDGDAAIESYRRERPDVVLMDIIMPHRNGIDALRTIKSEDSTACVLMVSAVGQEVVMREALDAGAMGFIVKPFQPAQVLSAVEECLQERAAA